MNELKELLNNQSDSYFFLPSEEEGQIHIQSSDYKDPGTKLDGSAMGDCYHIIIFKEDDDGAPIHLDKFEGILSAPVEYMTRMIKEDWFGMICRKTTTSSEFIERTFDKLKEV